MRKEEIVVIGAGPAGCAAAIQLKRLGIEPLLIDATGRTGGLVANAFSVENYPCLEPLTGVELADRLNAHLKRFGIEVEKGNAEKIELKQKGFEISCDSGSISARSAIVAVGTEPIELKIKGAAESEGKTLFYEVRELLDKWDGDASHRKVAVIGGGEAALDYSLSLARAGAEVRILVRGGKLRAQGRLVDLAMRNLAVRIDLFSEPSEMMQSSGRIELAMAGRNGKESAIVDAAVAAIGRRSAAGNLLSNLDDDLGSRVSTSVAGLFVAGDARFASLGQVGMAVGDGLAAAMAAAKELGKG